MGQGFSEFLFGVFSMTSNHLMFCRTARNHVQNGYFPTDSTTLDGIKKRLDIMGKHVRIFDPCCGEGHALAELADHLTENGAMCQSYGVELNAERAKSAKVRLNHVVQADIENCLLQARSVGLLFLNPPYGFNPKDQLSNDKAERMEEMFFSQTASTLQNHGILVLIVPTQSLTERFTAEIARYFTQLRMFKAGVDTYNQMVIMGIRPPTGTVIGKKQAQEQQKLLQAVEIAPELSDETDFWYEVPQAVSKPFRPLNFQLNAEILEQELTIAHNQTLWVHFNQWFSEDLHQEKRRPLCQLGQWHTALALAAGQVSGKVYADDGRCLLVKGATYKTKVVTASEEYDDKGNLTVTTVSLDRFVPSIRAINLTVQSPDYGQILTIK